MDAEELRRYALSFDEVEEGFPFGENTLVFKTNGKVFLLVSLAAFPLSFNVKCDPEKAVELREKYTSVAPGYHMNKKHWNTVTVDGSIPADELREYVKNSYAIVAGKKKRR